jgi:HK97 family phage major capsid protein
MSYKPTEGMVTEAQRGLDWRREHGRGGTEVGIARARDIVNGKNLSESTVKRMYSFFSRHEVDKQGEGFSQGEDGYPSNGRIAWALWGGDAGYSWSKQIVERLKKEDERMQEARPYPNEHAARINNPDKYVEFARDNDEFGSGIHVIYGILEDRSSEVQSIRFDSEKFTPDEAKAWLEEHDYNYIEFEEAIEERAVSGKALEMIKNKVEEHNEEVGDVASKRTTVGTLSKVYERGIGAYKTNPASVRPNVSSPEQWAAARINSFLFALRNGKFRSGKHDTDLLPEGHPLSTKNKEKTMDNKEDRHILAVNETDDSVVITFAKEHEEDMEESEPVEIVDEENSMHDEEERKVVDLMRYRTIDLSRADHIDEKNRRVRVGVSSESPVDRSFGREVLGHRAEDIDMEFMSSGTAPFLLDHDMTKQIGVIEEFKLDETAKRTIAVVRFGKSALAREVFEDVKDGIRMNISVGYKINKMERVSDDKGDYYRANWTPLEVSSVAVPADQSKAVGVGRSETNLNFKQEIKMEKEIKQDINLDEVRSKTVEEAKAEFKRNSKEIIDLAVRHNKRDLADKAISEGISVEEFRGVLLENIANDKPLETPSDIGMTAKEVKRFSVVKALRALANPTDRKAQADAAFEFECSEEAARQNGTTAQGIMLPADVLAQWGQRDINSSDDSTLIPQDFKGGDFIDVLRNQSSVMAAGATMLRGLQGSVVIPKKTAASSGGWIATEGNAASESEFTSGSVTMSPKVIGAYTDVTRLLLQQSSLDIENLIRDDLTQSIAIAIDLGALAGSGSSGQPTGVKNTSGVNTTTFAAANPTFGEIVGMESAVAADNALLGNLSYICKPADYGTLKTTSKDSGSGQFVVEPDGRMNGYNVVRSNQVTSGDFYFGNFGDLLIGMYGSLDITVDPYSLSNTGSIRIVALQTVDVAVRHAVSFCVSNDGA